MIKWRDIWRYGRKSGKKARWADGHRQQYFLSFFPFSREHFHLGSIFAFLLYLKTRRIAKKITSIQGPNDCQKFKNYFCERISRNNEAKNFSFFFPFLGVGKVRGVMGGRSFGGKGRWKRRSLVPKNLPANNPFSSFFCRVTFRDRLLSSPPLPSHSCCVVPPLACQFGGVSCALTSIAQQKRKEKGGETAEHASRRKKFSTRARDVLPFFQFSLFSSLPCNQVTFISSFIPRLLLPAAVIRIEQFVGGSRMEGPFFSSHTLGFRGFFFPLSPSPPLCADRPRNGNRQT